MTELTINSSFDELETALESRFQQEKPRKPQLQASASPDELRKHADDLEAHDLALQSYNEALKVFGDKQSEIYRIWRFKLHQEYMSNYPNSVSELAYERAYERGHSAGYSEVRSHLSSITYYTNQVIAAVKSH